MRGRDSETYVAGLDEVLGRGVAEDAEACVRGRRGWEGVSGGWWVVFIRSTHSPTNPTRTAPGAAAGPSYVGEVADIVTIGRVETGMDGWWG